MTSIRWKISMNNNVLILKIRKVLTKVTMKLFYPYIDKNHSSCKENILKNYDLKLLKIEEKNPIREIYFTQK